MRTCVAPIHVLESSLCVGLCGWVDVVLVVGELLGAFDVVNEVPHVALSAEELGYLPSSWYPLCVLFVCGELLCAL